MNVANRLDSDILDTLRWLWTVDPLADSRVTLRAREILLDTVGCAMSGLGTDTVRNFAARLARSEPGALRIPGMPAGLSTSGFLHAFSAGACCFEAAEGLASAQGRPGLHVVPAVLARAMTEQRTLRDVLAATVVGYEVGGRIGEVYRALPGMHVDGTFGTFGAAAAIAYLATATPETALDAINHAACQLPLSLYFPITHGSTTRNAYVGHGAALGNMAVTAALAGLGGPDGSIVEHMRLALGSTAVALTTAPDTWLILRGYLKKYPMNRHAHYGITAATQWHTQHGARWRDIERVRLKVHRNAIVYCGVRRPGTVIQAQFSLSYGLAWALINGDLTTAAFDPAAIASPEVRRLEALATIEEHPTLTEADRRGAVLEVTVGGRTASYTVDHVPGDPERPLTREELVHKFTANVTPVIGERAAGRTARAILDGPLELPLTLPD